MLEDCETVFNSQLSLLHAGQTQFFQPFFICQVLQSSNHLDGPLLDPLQFFNVFFELEGPRLGTVFHMCGLISAEESGITTSFGLLAADNTIFLHCCKSTRLAHVQLVIHQYSWVLLPPIIVFNF